ncbi:MAG TPA: GTPase, partial [Beijerinckiaceae bacterium]|nr:GTPase [Beijerinckiaceae bacterium]
MTPAVAIVGRPNVGKSTLFNRLVGRRLALVDDRPGVTRDRREGEARLGSLRFRIIDTAGLEEAEAGSLLGRMRAQTEAAIDEAEQRLAALAKEAPPGYQTLSRFRLAAEQGRQNPDAGAKAYDALAADGGVEPVMQDLARLRAAMLRIDTADSAAVQPSLERLATPTNVWR